MIYLLILVWGGNFSSGWASCSNGTCTTTNGGWLQPATEMTLPTRFHSLAGCAKAGYLAQRTPGNTAPPTGFLCARVR